MRWTEPMSLEDAKEFVRWLVRKIGIRCGYVAAILVVLTLSPIGRDNTDGAWPDRSGMKPLRDAFSGCQYLKVGGGGITPRIDAHGRHMGCKALEAEVE